MAVFITLFSLLKAKDVAAYSRNWCHHLTSKILIKQLKFVKIVVLLKISADK
jgi:hypothetical protein